MIAKHEIDFAPLRAPAVGLIRPFGARLPVKGAPQHTVVAGGPLESAIRRDRQRLIGNRTFRWPQSDRRHSQRVAHVRARTLQLLASIFRILKSAWQRDARS